MSEVTVRALREDDRSWAETILEREWGSQRIVTRGRVHTLDNLSGFVAELDGERVGLLTYRVYGAECELVTMNALMKGKGIGTSLLSATCESATESKCRGIWLITTNDNLDAMRFYQKRGFYFVAVHRDAIKKSRKLRSDIPEIGNHGIPIRDEIELVLPL